MVDPITTLGLCAGVGWLDLAVEFGCRHFGWDHRVAAYCEWEAYAANCLLARMEESSLEPAPVWCGDLGQFAGRSFRGSVDGIVAGFPCQPWSAAGKQLGTDDERWLWPAIVRVVDDVEPGFVFLENVSALIAGGGLEHVLSDLAARGFDAEWCCLTAEAVRAAHRRERVFILAYDPGQRGQLFGGSNGRTGRAGAGEVRAGGIRGQQRSTVNEQPELCDPAVAHASIGDKRERQRISAAAGVGAESRTQRLGEELDDTAGARREETVAGADQRLARQRSRERLSGDGCGAVAVSGGDGRGIGQPRGRSRRRTAAGGSGGVLADAGTDLRGQGAEVSQGRESESAVRGVFAPGPAADWSGIPEALWPATERGFRVLVDGSPVVLDESRADQLRCGGNGVVALQGAAAFVELVRRAMKR